VNIWKTIAGFVVAAGALSACAAVMITGLPLPAETAPGRAAKPVASTEDATGPGEPGSDVIVGSTEHRSGKHIALTFDDGPDPMWTTQVLDLLDRYEVRATFCLVGTNVQAQPDLVRRIVDAGHALCDHTMTHDEELPSLPVDERAAEIVDCHDAIVDAAPDARVRYFRAPAGAFSPTGDPDPDSVQRIAARQGMRSLAWSIDTEDWTRPGADAIVSAVRQAGDDDVVLLHDGGGDRQQTVAALERILPWLIDQGYRFDLPA
jgi:peptidoglycan/xylan/chitin deacetylase (PgdA/CDA1 family)